MPLEEIPSYVFFDPVVLQFFQERMPEESFGIVRPTVWSVTLALEKSDVREIWLVAAEDEEAADLLLEKHFSFMMGRFRKRDFRRVTIAPDASAGFPMQMSKDKALRTYLAYYAEYCRPGVQRPPVVWKVTPKIEYLPLEDILAGKIRLFRNPPLDYLLLEKVYFEDQDEHLVSHPCETWSALGFVKENGGWHTLMSKLNRFKYKFTWDVWRWDKKVGPHLLSKDDNLRRKMYHPEEVINEVDWQFLTEESSYCYELLPNGQVIATAIAQKSGKLRTSSGNTTMHIWCVFAHIARVVRKYDIRMDYDTLMRENFLAIYSDDNIGGTNMPELFQEADLRESFQLLGLDIQDFKFGLTIEGLVFLGAECKKFGNLYVPLYNEKRMIFATLYVSGRMDDTTRCQRIAGLAHNLAFSEHYGPMLVELSHWLNARGRWVGHPLLDLGKLRAAYYPSPPAWVTRAGNKQAAKIVLHCKSTMSTTQRTKRRTEAALEKLEKFNMLTPEGRNWLIAATDPFHDSEFQLSGFPDLNVSGSIVQCVKKTFQISQPAGIGTLAWDAHFVAWNQATQRVGQANTLYNGAILNNAGSAANFTTGGVSCLATATGNQGFFNSNSGGTTGIYNAGGISLDSGSDGYMQGVSRVIGYGMEIINTTAALYKQGQVVVYRQPTAAIDQQETLVYGGVAAGVFTPLCYPSTYTVASPPTTPASAMLLEGSCQWNAEEGAYLVCTTNSLNNYPSEPSPVMYLVQDSESVESETGTTLIMNQNTQSVTIPSTTNPITVPQTNSILPHNMSGAYFSGLSPQTTFTVNVTWYVERFPTPFDTQLVVLATPSAGWDQFALELYAAAMRDMPAGVRVNENPLGEWFQDVVHQVAQNASPVLNALSVVHPGFGMAGQMAGVIAKATQHSKPKQQQPVTLKQAQGAGQIPSNRQKTPQPKKAKAKQKTGTK